MKYFLAFFLFAFVAGLRADEFEDLFLDDEIDGGDPDRHPYVQCKIDLYKCIKAGNVSKAECLKKYKACIGQLIPTVPPFVIACKNDLKQCLSATSFWDFKGKGKCYLAFAKCLKNKGPSEVLLDVSEDAGQMEDDFEDLLLDDEIDGGDPDRHPYVQCKIDLYDCLRLDKESNVECLKKYKKCMAQLLPSKPPVFIQCKIDLAKCIKAGNDSKPECLRKYRTCLAQLLPTKPPAIIQCKIDLYKCIKAGTEGKLECLKKYKACIGQLIPTVPAFVTACKNALKQCLSGASTLGAKGSCFVAFAKCLKNKGPSEVLLDAIEDAGQMEDMSGVLQCKKDLYNCFKDGKDKKGCLKDYGACVDALIPPFVKQCSAEAKECFSNASGWRERYRCTKDYVTCLRSGASTQAPPEPSAA